MESTSLPAFKELRIQTSTCALTPVDTEPELPAVEAAQLSPKVDRVRHHLIPARTTTCVRAPCLKRQVSVPISSITTDLAANRLESASIQDRVASNPLPTSFAAPRNLVLQAGSRHVHFDEAPPEEFFVLSGESYDRRPIKCTQGGSEFDMSLPPRSTSYNGDDGIEDDASSTDDAPVAMESAEQPAPDVGFFRDPLLENWACIKNGTETASVGYQPRHGLMASGRSLHFSALSSLQHASALNGGDVKPNDADSQPQAPSQKVSLPVHGFRSFGGLQNSLAPEITAVAAPEKPAASPKQEVPSPESTPPALRNLSPDATPMPSPSLHKSIGAYASVSYFGVSSNLSSPVITAEASLKEDPSSNDTKLGTMEVLRDVPSPNAEASTATAATHDFRATEPVHTISGLSSPTFAKPAPITVKVPDTGAHLAPRRLGLERRMAEKDAVRLSGLRPPTPTSGSTAASASSPGWSSLLGITSSPLSSRCSSVDPWSSLSSDGDGDGTESPGNENSWISSNCTSPDLSPFEQVATEGFHPKAGLNNASGSTPSWLEARNIKHVDIVSAQSNGGSNLGRASISSAGEWDHELNTPKNTDFADETKFSSSVETVNTVSWEHKHLPAAAPVSLFSGLSSADVSASEATTPDSSRRPSFHHADLPSQRLSPRLRSSFGERDGSAIDNLDDDDSQVLRLRSLSRDGHAKKKSTKCRYCRTLRQRIKISSTESSAPTSSGGSAQITDAEGDGEGEAEGSSVTSAAVSCHSEPLKNKRDLTSSTEVSEMEEEEARSRSSLSDLRASVRSLSMDEWSSNASRSRSRDKSAVSRLAIALDVQHERESSNSPGESCSESPHSSSVNLPTMCTCDKKREKERIKKKIRKERELERERDREWERDQARGRQKKLFGESFGDADTSCLSALDGF
ncbi:uncharacterized protein UTRI_04105 [Ustilago trichophora]|uniref:Uncharacterized protein n=1 Tax=Ustilago trichophora TaxID=86804 RepID=A0A5C3EAF4_9BASI|nr:uncharacterized protein UTRI_04105 [Ustilago trichophora]